RSPPRPGACRREPPDRPRPRCPPRSERRRIAGPRAPRRRGPSPGTGRDGPRGKGRTRRRRPCRRRRPAPRRAVGERACTGAAGPAGPQQWRSCVASALLFAAAAGAGYMSFFPERWTRALAPVPWREIALGAAVLALSLIRGWPIGRVFARVVMLLGAFALFP